MAIGFGQGGAKESQFSICASDASFANNFTDRKSSQGYVIKLFDEIIAGRADKQDTVTTSSTEAELVFESHDILANLRLMLTMA